MRVCFAAAVLAATVSVYAAVASPDLAAARSPRHHVQPPLGWHRLVFSENFSGPSGTPPSPARWNFDIGGSGWGSEELEFYTDEPANASLDGDGHLAITARAASHPGAEGFARGYTSARLQTLNKFNFQYGLVQARIQVPAGVGLLSQFWMLGTDGYRPFGWPASGEIDAMEVLGAQPNVVKGSVHGPWALPSHGATSAVRSPASLAQGFHVYAVEWRPDRITFLLDGARYRSITPTDLPPGSVWPFAHPFFLLLDLVVGGTAAKTPVATTVFPARMLVDWIRVWK